MSSTSVESLSLGMFVANTAFLATIAAASSLIVSAVMKSRSPGARYSVLLCGLVLMLLSPVFVVASAKLGLGVVAYPVGVEVVSRQPEAVDEAPGEEDAGTRGTKGPTVPGKDGLQRPTVGGGTIDENIPQGQASLFEGLLRETRMSAVLVRTWAAGALLFLLCICYGISSTIRTHRSSVLWEDGRLNDIARDAALAVGLPYVPLVRVSDRAPGPLSFGLAVRTVLLPEHMADNWPPQKLKQILLHECAHFVRADHWAIALKPIAVALFYWNPFTWLVLRDLESERENACDVYVAQKHVDRCRFAGVLVEVAALAHARPQITGAPGVLGHGKKSFERRIRTLTSKHEDWTPRLSPLARLLACAFAACMACVLVASSMRPSEGRGILEETAKPVRIAPVLAFRETFDDNENWQFNGSFRHPNFADYPGIKGWENGTLNGEKHPKNRGYLNIVDGILRGPTAGYGPNFEPTLIHRQIELDGTDGFAVEFRCVSEAGRPNQVAVWLLSDWKRGQDKAKYYRFVVYGESSQYAIDIHSTSKDSFSDRIHRHKAGPLLNDWHTYKFIRTADGRFQLLVDGQELSGFDGPADTAYDQFNRIAVSTLRRGSQLDWIRVYSGHSSVIAEGRERVAGAKCTVGIPSEKAGRTYVGDGEGGVVNAKESGWDGDFASFCEARSNGSRSSAITWETTEIYPVPAGAKDLLLHGKVEFSNWQSHAGIHVYDYERGKYELLIGGDGAGYGLHERSVQLSDAHLQDRKIRVRAVLFAKHSPRAYARYYDSEVSWNR